MHVDLTQLKQRLALDDLSHETFVVNFADRTASKVSKGVELLKHPERSFKQFAACEVTKLEDTSIYFQLLSVAWTESR